MNRLEVSEDEKIWGFVAWLIPLIGGILVLVLKPSYRYARYWAYLSISFFIVVVGAQLVSIIFDLIPIIGKLISALIGLGLLITWIIGVLRSLEKTFWKPPVIYDIAKIINPKIDDYISESRGTPV
ncbi:MAG: hypothetical protein QW816_06780 [Desulfurococcaceae archaeon]